MYLLKWDSLLLTIVGRQEQPHEHQSMEQEVEVCMKVFGSVSWIV